MRKVFCALISIWLWSFMALAQGPSRVAVMAYTNGNLITPTNFFASNLLAGANVSITLGASGKVTIATIATNVVSTNFAALFVTNFIEGTNYTWYFATNVPRGIVTFEWLTNLVSTLSTNASMSTNANQFLGVPLSIKANYLTTNAIIYPRTGDAGTNLVLHVEDIATRGYPILQVVDDNGATVLLEIDNSAVLNANGSGVTNVNGATIQATTINSNQMNAALDALYRAGSMAVTLNSVTGVVQSYVGNNATNVNIASSTFHTNWANAISNLVQTKVAPTTNGVILYVSTTGNDATAIKGRSDKPWLTVSNALNSIVNGDTMYVFPGNYTNTACIHVGNATNLGDAPWKLFNRTNIMLDFGHARFFWPTQFSGLVIKDSSNVTVLGYENYGNKSYTPPFWMTNMFNAATGGVWAPITIGQSSHVTIEDCVISGVWDHGILAENFGAVYYKATNTVIVRNCLISDCGWKWSTWYDGAGIVSGNGWVIQNNIITESSRGIEPYPMDRPTVFDKDRAIFVIGNYSWNNQCEGILAERCGGLISGNVVGRDPDYPEQPGTGWSAGISLRFNNNLLVEGNLLIGRDRGIIINEGSTNLTIRGNTIRGGAMPIAANSGAHDRLTIEGNDTYDTSYYWHFGSSTNNRCRIVNNHLWDCTTNTAIGEKTLIFAQSGMWNSNTISGNTFEGKRHTNATIAADFTGSSGTGNRWVDNTIQAPIVTHLTGQGTLFSTFMDWTGFNASNGILTLSNIVIPIGATSNYVWTCTNATTGQGEWRAAPASSGGATNWSAGLTNDTHLAIVQNGTNATGAIKTLKAGSNVTITEEGSTNLVIAASLGGGAATKEDVTNTVTQFQSTNAASGVRGLLTGTDWDTFNGKAAPSLVYTVGANGTNYSQSVTSGLAALTYTVGANATNFTYSIGANDTNYAKATTNGLAALSYTIGANATNYANSRVGTNFYNAEVSNSVRSLNGFFTNLTVYSDFTVSNLSATTFTLSNIAPGLAYFSTADTNLASLPTGAVGKILMSTNGAAQYAWVDMPTGSGDAGGTNARQIGSAVLTNLTAAGITNWIGAGSMTLTTNNGAITFTGASGGPEWAVGAGNFGYPTKVIFNSTGNNSVLGAKPGTELTLTFGDNYSPQPADLTLSNLVAIGLTNYQSSSMVLSNFVGTVASNPTNIVGSGGVTVSSNAGTYTIGYTGAGITLSDVTNGAPLAFDDTIGAAGNVNAAGIVTAGGTNLMSWIGAVSNYVTSSTNSASVTNWITTRQLATANLTNWSSLATSWVTTVASAFTNNGPVTNWTVASQPATANLSNWSSLATSWVTTVAAAYTNAGPVTNWTVAAQPANAVLSNFVATVASNPTNIVGAGLASVSSNAGTYTITGRTNEVASNPQTNGSYTVLLSTNTTMLLTNSQSGNVAFSLSNPVDRCWFVVRMVGGSAGATNLFPPMDGTQTITWSSTNNCPNATNPAVASGKVCTIFGRVWVNPSPPSTNIDVFANVTP